MNEELNKLMDDAIAKAETIALIIAKAAPGMNARAYLDATDAVLSLKLVRVEMEWK